MSTALLVLLLVDLALILALLGVLIRRRSTVTGRRGAFKGKLRVVEGELEGLSREWTSGYGHWVRDVLVWDVAPLLVRTRLIPVDGTDASGIHREDLDDLGKRPVVAPLLVGRRQRLELAASEEDLDLALGPFAVASAVGSLVRSRSGLEGLDDPYLNSN
jgi:hypothetical protein